MGDIEIIALNYGYVIINFIMIKYTLLMHCALLLVRTRYIAVFSK